MTLKNIPIGKRLMGAFAIFTSIILIACIISFWNASDIDKKANEITNLNFEKATLASAILTNLQAINSETNKAVYTKDKAPLEKVAEKRKLYRDAMEKLEKLETKKEGKELINKFKTTVAEGKEQNVKLGKALEAGDFETASTLLKEHVNPALGKFVDIVGELEKYQHDGVQEKYREILSDKPARKDYTRHIRPGVADSLRVGKHGDHEEHHVPHPRQHRNRKDPGRREPLRKRGRRQEG